MLRTWITHSHIHSIGSFRKTPQVLQPLEATRRHWNWKSDQKGCAGRMTTGCGSGG